MWRAGWHDGNQVLPVRREYNVLPLGGKPHAQSLDAANFTGHLCHDNDLLREDTHALHHHRHPPR